MTSKRVDDLFDLSKLSESSVRKYQSYFKIAAGEEELRSRVKEHFNSQLQVESNDVLEKLLELKREEKGNKGRGMRPARGAN